MRHNIMRLINEVRIYKTELKLLTDAPHASLKDATEANRLRHAIALCYRHIGKEIDTRLENNERVNLDIDQRNLEAWEKESTADETISEFIRGQFKKAAEMADQAEIRYEYLIRD